MKITKLLLALFLSLNFSWTPCHASSEPLPETDTTNLWNNKYIQGTALALGTSFVAYKYLIAPSIENCHETLLNACESGNLLLFKLFHLLGAKQIVEHGYTYLDKAYDNDHLEIVKYLLNIPPFDKHKSFFAYLSNNQSMLNDCIQNNVYLNNQFYPYYPLDALMYDRICQKIQKWYPLGDTLLHMACRNGDITLVNALLEKNSDVNIKNCSDETPLHIACQNGDTALVNVLLEKNSDVNVENYDGETPLRIACTAKNIDIVKLLIEHKADINIQNYNDTVCLYIACKNNDLKMVHYLIDHGAQLNSTSYGNTCLHIACYRGYEDIVRFVLEKNSDTNIKNIHNKTPLEVACYGSKLTIVKLLIDNKFTTEKDKSNALFIACKHQQPSILRLLLENNVDPNAQNDNGNTVLHEISICHIAPQKDDEWSILQLLTSKNANVNIKNKQGNTPLHLVAKERGCLEIIKYLIEMGADLNETNNNGETAYKYIGLKDPLNYHKLRTEYPNNAIVEKILLAKSLAVHCDSCNDIPNVITNKYITRILNSVEVRMWKPVLHEINVCKYNDLQTSQAAEEICLCNQPHTYLTNLLCYPKEERKKISDQLRDYHY